MREMLKERTTNILKRLTFKYHSVGYIDNTTHFIISVEIINNVTQNSTVIHFPYDMLKFWYEHNNLKYDLIKEYIISNIVEDNHYLEELQ